MPLPPMIEVALTQGLLLLAFGLAGGWAAERLNLPRLAGGLLTGLLLGPTVLGAIAPDAHRYLFLGGVQEHRQLRAFERQYEEDLATLRATGVSSVAVEAFEDRAEHRRSQLTANARQAGEPHRRAAAFLAALALAAVLMALTYAAPMSGPIAGLRGAEAMALAGWLTAGVAGGLLGWLFLRFGRAGPDGRMIDWLPGLAVGCAAASTPFSARLLDRLREPQKAQRSGMFICLLAVFFTYVVTALSIARRSPPYRFTTPGDLSMVWAMAILLVLLLAANLALRLTRRRLNPMTWARQPFTLGAVIALTLAFLYAAYLLLGLIAGLAVGAVLAGGLLQNLKTVEPARIALTLAQALLFALVGSRLDLITHFDWLLTLAVLIAYCDAKILGIMLAARLLARQPWLEGLRTGIAIASAGTGALAVALILRTGNLIDAPAFTALVIAAATTTLLAQPALRMLDESA